MRLVSMRSVGALILMALCGGLGLAAQSVATVQISGVVKDASGATIPGAKVVATQTATQFIRTTQTGAHGAYALTNLPIGPYTLQVSNPGFSTYRQTGIVLEVASNPTLNVTLQVGAQTQEVSVAANTAMVETHATGVGQVVSQRDIVELPLNGRQVTNLILLAGGTTPGARGDLNSNKNYPTQNISVAGGMTDGIAYVMDGASANDPFNSENLPLPFPDALQEFKVQTSALPAQYGAHASAAVNVVTKSGSNQFHGDLFEFVRNGAFNANNFFSNATVPSGVAGGPSLPRDSLKRNQFGGTVGGPIVKNKLFFFTGYQGTITRSNPRSRSSTVPTQAMLNGDWSAFVSPTCQGKKIYSELKAPFVVNGTTVTLPTADYSAAALKFLKNVPVSTDPCGTIDYGISQNSHDNDIIGRVDYTHSAQQSMFFRYYVARYVLPIASSAASNILEANQVAQNDQGQEYAFGDNYALSPNAVNVFTLSLARTYADRIIPPYPDAADLGVNVYSPIPAFMGLSVRGTGGGFSLGAGGTNPGHFNSTAPQIADDFTLVHGNHQLQFGTSWIHAIMNTVNNRPTNGAFTFNDLFTGTGLGDFLTGDLDSFLQGNPDWENDRENLLGVYAQDAWKINPGLTLSYGVRWEPFLQQMNWDKNDYIDDFNLSNFVNGVRTSKFVNAPAGLIFPGDPGFPGNNYSENHMGDFEPRLGVIWDPTGHGTTSVRADFGTFYDRPYMFTYTRFSNNPPWGASLSFNLANPGGFSDPWADPNSGYKGSNPWPTLAAVGSTMPFPLEGVYVSMPLDVKPPVVSQWGMSVQHQFGLNDAVSIDYLGNETAHLWTGTELDPVDDASCAASVSAYTSCSRNQNAHRFLVMNYPTNPSSNYYSTIGSVDDGGTASYEGLLLSEQHRLSGGLTFMANYTWSHCITDPPTAQGNEFTGPTYNDPANRRLDRGDCAADIRNVLNASMVGNSPWRLHGIGGALANHWMLSLNFSSRWGQYSSAGLGGPVTNPALSIGGQGSRADIAPGQDVLVPMTNVGTLQDPRIQYANPDAYTVPALGTFGNAGVGTIEDPGYWNLDSALSRNLQVGEGKVVQLRWEMFNVLNHANFDAPSVDFGGSNVGVITSAADPRIMQFAVKYTF
ncbi:MAG: carboxypeptidase regulatory-like domain-containing protein [Terriglobales bacterium]